MPARCIYQLSLRRCPARSVAAFGLTCSRCLWQSPRELKGFPLREFCEDRNTWKSKGVLTQLLLSCVTLGVSCDCCSMYMRGVLGESLGYVVPERSAGAEVPWETPPIFLSVCITWALDRGALRSALGGRLLKKVPRPWLTDPQDGLGPGFPFISRQDSRDGGCGRPRDGALRGRFPHEASPLPAQSITRQLLALHERSEGKPGVSLSWFCTLTAAPVEDLPHVPLRGMTLGTTPLINLTDLLCLPFNSAPGHVPASLGLEKGVTGQLVFSVLPCFLPLS